MKTFEFFTKRYSVIIKAGGYIAAKKIFIEENPGQFIIDVWIHH